MAYLHCHNCDWGQDDFWKIGGYNPIRHSSWLEKDLLRDKVRLDFAEVGIEPDGADDEGLYVTGQSWVAFNLRRYAKSVESMAVRTDEEWREVKDTFCCPNCGSINLDID